MLRIATRGSPLALWQAETIRSMLHKLHPNLGAELVIVTSSGDIDRSRPLHEMGGVGLFTKEIQDAVIDGRADLAVHSLKDLPTQSHPKLTLVAVPQRGSTQDALIAPRYREVEKLPENARIATGSLRRRAQLLRFRPDFQITDLRGNVETRLKRLDEDGLDAIVLAVAGLERLGLHDRITQRLGSDIMLSAVGQGALGIECRADDEATIELCKDLNHMETRAAVLSERAFLATLEGGCQLPIGALATVKNGEIELHGNVTSKDGKVQFSGKARGDDPIQVGTSLANRLLQEGASKVL